MYEISFTCLDYFVNVAALLPELSPKISSKTYHSFGNLTDLN